MNHDVNNIRHKICMAKVNIVIYIVVNGLQFLFIHDIEIYFKYTIPNKCVKHEMLFTTLHLFNVYVPFFLLSLLSTRQIDLKDSFLSSTILFLLYIFFYKSTIKCVLLNKKLCNHSCQLKYSRLHRKKTFLNGIFDCACV